MGKILFALKLVFVVVFTSLIYFVIDYFVSIVKSGINLEIIDLICYLGVIKAFNVLISLTIAGYVANQLIAYFRN